MPSSDGESTTILVRVHPRSSRNRHEFVDDILHVWVTSAPVDGAANKSLIRYLAGLAGVPASQIEILGGETSRTKRIRLPLKASDLEERVQGSIQE